MQYRPVPDKKDSPCNSIFFNGSSLAKFPVLESAVITARKRWLRSFFYYETFFAFYEHPRDDETQ